MKKLFDFLSVSNYYYYYYYLFLNIYSDSMIVFWDAIVELNWKKRVFVSVTKHNNKMVQISIQNFSFRIYDQVNSVSFCLFVLRELVYLQFQYIPSSHCVYSLILDVFYLWEEELKNNNIQIEWMKTHWFDDQKLLLFFFFFFWLIYATLRIRNEIQ